MKEFPFYSSFSSEIKVLVSQEFDANLALASLDKIKEFVPDINPDEQIDLLPIAFNACVANRVNKNGDVIDTETAIRIYKNFINKPINIEHNRERVIGTILKSGFSKFGTDEPISEETAATMKEPFNITLGGVIWKVVNPRTAKLIENSSDPTDPDYQKVSASWELGFSEYDLVVLDQDEKNLASANIISNEQEVSKLKNYLKSEGGSGILDNGKKIYRRVLNKVVPLGIGLTETPAADVKGIITNLPEAIASEENSSQNSKSNVTDNNKTFMKIEKISDITDEALKQALASDVTNFIAQEIKKASDAFVAEKSATENALKQSETKFSQLANDYEQLKTQLAQVTENLNKVQSENEERVKQEVFSSRMAQFDNDFDLTPEERELITNDIASMDEDSFAAYRKKMDVLMKSKKKGEKGMKEEKKKEMAMASVSSEVSQVIDQVVDNAKVKDAGLPNTSEPSKNIVEKYKGAFSLDQFDIKV